VERSEAEAIYDAGVDVVVQPGKAPGKRTKGRSPRKQAGQPGHEGQGRELLPTSAANEVIEHQCHRVPLHPIAGAPAG
jgi:hypothetical protein